MSMVLKSKFDFDISYSCEDVAPRLRSVSSHTTMMDFARLGFDVNANLFNFL